MTISNVLQTYKDTAEEYVPVVKFSKNKLKLGLC